MLARGLFPSQRARSTMCKPRPLTPSKRSVPLGACAPALAVSGEETKHTSLLLRARCAALFAASTCPLEGHCTDERPLSIGARSWCDMHAAASNAKPALRVTRHRRAAARCNYGGGAAFVSRWLPSAYVQQNGTESTRRLSPSARAGGATCVLRHPTPNQRCVSRGVARCHLRGGVAFVSRWLS